MAARNPDTGSPITTPAYEPLKAIVASRDRSSGGAQKRQMPWQAGYVTPCACQIDLRFRPNPAATVTPPVGTHLDQSLDHAHANQNDRIQVYAQRYEHIAEGRSDDGGAEYPVGRKERRQEAARNLRHQVAPEERRIDGALHVRGPRRPGGHVIRMGAVIVREVVMPMFGRVCLRTNGGGSV